MMKHEQEMKELRQMLFQKGLEHCYGETEAHADDSRKFKTLGCRLRDPEDGMLYTMDVTPSLTNSPATCCIRMGCVTPGTDRLRSVFVFWGTKQEVLDWFQDPGNLEKTTEIYYDLRQKALDD